MRICIINSSNLCFNPRTPKEAAALAGAGHAVRVVGVARDRATLMAQARLADGQGWRYVAIVAGPDGLVSRWRWAASGVRSRLYESAARLTGNYHFADLALARLGPELLAAALAEPADLYLAHNLPNLPVAAAAARAMGGRLGFDIEDYHPDEDTPGNGKQFRRHLKRVLFERYGRQCHHLTATSEAMADIVASEHRFVRPVVVYNVFPLAWRAGVPPPLERPRNLRDAGVRAYWFSQHVGLDRGLQDAIRAIALTKRPLTLHVRGVLREPTSRVLQALAAQVGVSNRLIFEPILGPEALIPDAARFDVGLALEQPLNRNRLVTVTNKMFTYILAGIVPVATNTPGQREVMTALGLDHLLYTPGDSQGLARCIDRATAPDSLGELQTRVWSAAETRWCWEVERRRLVGAIGSLEVSWPLGRVISRQGAR